MCAYVYKLVYSRPPVVGIHPISLINEIKLNIRIVTRSAISVPSTRDFGLKLCVVQCLYSRNPDVRSYTINAVD